MLLRIAALALVAVLAGCGSAGKKFDTTHVDDIVDGKTTKPEVQGWFGEPHQLTKPLKDHPKGGVERWTWSYAFSVAGGSTESEALVVDFDAKDVVCDHAYSKTKQ